MGILGLFKKKKEYIGWDAITNEFERIYPGQKNPIHYGTIKDYQLGGNDPLKGISIYDSGDSWHFVTYGLSELYDKHSDNKDISGFGMEFTYRLKKGCYGDEKFELECACGLLQQIARTTFQNNEIYKPYEYLYTGQKDGIDGNRESKLTGFITIPDTKANDINTLNGKVSFVEFIGVTNEELINVIDKKITVKELYEKLGTDITNYNRKSMFDNKINFKKIDTNEKALEEYKKGNLEKIYILAPMFGGKEEDINILYVPIGINKIKEKYDNMIADLLDEKKVKSYKCDFEYKEKSVIPSKIIIKSGKDGKDVFVKIIDVW